MNSDSICNLLDDFVDGDLSASLAMEFETHLESCEACRADISEINELSSAVKSAWKQVILTEPELDVAHRNTVNPDGRLNGDFGKRVLIAAALAASLLMAIGFSWFWQLDGPEVVDSGRANRGATIEASPNEAIEVVAAESSDQQSSYQTSYASAKFDEAAQGVKIESNAEFTIYQVAPKVTFSRTN